ncbi:MAG TPA: DEAD/DEAH box helicase, partial [Duganella sp.]|nr:DEAD/DEAH box helicase [Duganella sp.]
MTDIADQQNDDELMRQLGLTAKGFLLSRMEGRVFLRLTGMVEYNGTHYPYDLVPAQGVLAKPSKWRKMDGDARSALLRERASDAVVTELHGYVAEFVQEMADACDDCELDPQPFLQGLADMQISEPAGTVFDRIRLRLEHAVEREMEEQHAERTRQSINLAEYPASFDVARRIKRKFVALLGPTNSGKTHQAIEALAKAPSGVYLAPLRLLALENYERLQAMEQHGKPLAVSLVTGEERRLVAGATHVASTVEMLDTRTPVDVAVIDEIQMLADRDRGSAWTAAVCGAP